MSAQSPRPVVETALVGGASEDVGVDGLDEVAVRERPVGVDELGRGGELVGDRGDGQVGPLPADPVGEAGLVGDADEVGEVQPGDGVDVAGGVGRPAEALDVGAGRGTAAEGGDLGSDLGGRGRATEQVVALALRERVEGSERWQGGRRRRRRGPGTVVVIGVVAFDAADCGPAPVALVAATLNV